MAIVEWHLNTKSVDTVFLRVTTLSLFVQDFSGFKTEGNPFISGQSAWLANFVLYILLASTMCCFTQNDKEFGLSINFLLSRGVKMRAD